ncbi:MAG: DinB family protein [Acidobacteriia bacterium]|nr:DinB family protein [Terriglobia bacterium]
MTYYGAKDIAAAFRLVRSNTIQIANEIPEDQYGFKPSKESRSVGQTLVHIALGPGFQHHIQSSKINDLKLVNFPDLMQKVRTEEAKPRDKAETIAFLKAEGDKFASFVESLSDSFLAEQVAMPPGATPATKSRFEMLLSPKEHEMHHRGQLMTMQRMIGQVPHLTRQMNERMAQMAAAKK